METSTPHPEKLEQIEIDIKAHTSRLNNGPVFRRGSKVLTLPPNIRSDHPLLQGVPLLWGPQRPASSIAICVSDLTASTCYLSSCELFLYLSFKVLARSKVETGTPDCLRRG